MNGCPHHDSEHDCSACPNVAPPPPPPRPGFGPTVAPLETKPQTFPKGTRARASADREARTIGWCVVRYARTVKRGVTRTKRFWWMGFDRDANADTWGEILSHATRHTGDAIGRQFALAALHTLRAKTIGDDDQTYKLVRILRRDVRADERKRAAKLVREWFRVQRIEEVQGRPRADFHTLIEQIESDAP